MPFGLVLDDAPLPPPRRGAGAVVPPRGGARHGSGALAVGGRQEVVLSDSLPLPAARACADASRMACDARAELVAAAAPMRAWAAPGGVLIDSPCVKRRADAVEARSRRVAPRLEPEQECRAGASGAPLRRFGERGGSGLLDEQVALEPSRKRQRGAGAAPDASARKRGKSTVVHGTRGPGAAHGAAAEEGEVHGTADAGEAHGADGAFLVHGTGAEHGSKGGLRDSAVAVGGSTVSVQKSLANDALLDVEPHVLAALVSAREAMRLCSVPERPMKGWGSAVERETDFIRRGSQALAAKLPESVCVDLAGGSEAVEQMGGSRQASALAAAVLRKNAGREGCKLFQVLKAIAYIEGYARAMGYTQVWPVKAGVAWLLVAGEHRRATAAGVGSRGGASVGDQLRALFLFMSKVRLPIEADRLVLASAAPEPSPCGNSEGSAATMPIKWWCQIEVVASWPNSCPMRFWARSLILAGLGVSLRVADGVRVTLSMDVAPHGDRIVRVDAVVPSSSRSKDGLPIIAFAVLEGFTGPLAWAEEHVADVGTLGQVFPAWDGPRGSQSHFAAADRLLRSVVDPQKIMRPLDSILAQWPLGLERAERIQVGVRGHSFHGSPSDLEATIGEWPAFPFALEERDKMGFSEPEVSQTGHWLRRRGLLHDERAADDVRRAASTGVGRPAGAASQRQQQSGRYARGAGRDGDRTTQIKLRARLTRIVRAAISHYAPGGWMDLADGPESRLILAPL